MADYVVAMVVVGAFGFLAVWGESAQTWLQERRISRHTCHTSCVGSRWCRCGCRDGVFGILTETGCAMCGTQLKFVEDGDDGDGWLSPIRLAVPESEEERGRTDGK